MLDSQELGGIQQFLQAAVGSVAGHIPGAVAAVMTDVKGFIAFRSRCQVTGWNRIIGIVSCREFYVGKEFLTGGLCSCSPSQEKQEQNAKSEIRFHLQQAVYAKIRKS